MNISNHLLHLHSHIKETTLQGRYIHFESIQHALLKNSSEEIGQSENGIPIHLIQIGNGKKVVLMWSQMHGNESTGTKAMFDLLNFLKTQHQTAQDILTGCTLYYIPILNPDGALLYTRENINKIDLNRDAVDLQAVESKILRKQLDRLQPEFCFNLHDQRTIFGVEGTQNSAVLSFLAPSVDKDRTLTSGRKETMNVISSIHQELSHHLPNQIGRYTDEFYPKATGDNFQKMGYNTILVESGHYPNDYGREETRKYTFLALAKGLHHIATQDDFSSEEEYFSIPNLNKLFYDIIHRYPNKEDVAFQYKEKLVNNRLEFVPEKVKNRDAKNYFTHKEIVFVS